MIMMDTGLAIRLARAYANYKIAEDMHANPPDPSVAKYWGEVKRHRERTFKLLAAQMATRLMDEGYHLVEGV